MANLIITIISIALVAVAALMGAYYGGAAFLQGQQKAKINTIINQAQQISAAWKLYVVNNAGNRALPNGWADLTNGGYITQMPASPAGAIATANFGSWNGWGAAKISASGVQYPVTNLDSGYAALVLLVDAGMCAALNTYFNNMVSSDTLAELSTSNNASFPNNTTGQCDSFAGENVFFFRVF